MQDLKVTIEVTEDGLFSKYLDQEKCSAIACKFIRETIIAIVIANTSAKTRVDNDYTEAIVEAAKMFSSKKSIDLFIDDELAESYVFCGSEPQNKRSLERLLGDLVKYECWYEDSISYNGNAGFCWEYDEQKIAIV